MRRPLIIYDFWSLLNFLLYAEIWFSFLSVHNTLGVRKQHGGVRSGGRSRTNSGEGELPHLHQPGQVPRGPLLLRPGQGQSHLQVSFRTKMLPRNSDSLSARVFLFSLCLRTWLDFFHFLIVVRNPCHLNISSASYKDFLYDKCQWYIELISFIKKTFIFLVPLILLPKIQGTIFFSYKKVLTVVAWITEKA